MMSHLKKISVVLVLVALGFSIPAFANIEEMKVYKEAYPGAKTKCAFCHTDAMPKKDAGKHELNEYGKKVTSIKEKPDASAYAQAGKSPEDQ